MGLRGPKFLSLNVRVGKEVYFLFTFNLAANLVSFTVLFLVNYKQWAKVVIGG